jgi:mannose-6-phosphate isomerase-like protein (cupin superfamily)
MDGEPAQVKVVLPGVAEVLSLGPSHVKVFLGGMDTGGRAVLVEEHLPPGPGSPPRHVHLRMDHTFFVTSGTVCFTAGSESVEVGPGGAVFIPRGVPHTFENGSALEEATFLEFDAPGRFDSYFRELSVLLREEGFVVDRIRELQSQYDTWPPS